MGMHRSLFIFATGILGVALSHHRAEAGSLPEVRFVSGVSAASFRRGPNLPWHQVDASGSVPEAAELTCERKCQLKAGPDNVLTLAPGTVLSVAAYLYVPMNVAVPPVTTAPNVAAREVRMTEGYIEAVSLNDKATPLVVSGPGSTHVALRGATVQIAIKGDRMVAQVNEGIARAGSNKRWLTIEKGRASTLTADGYPTTPRSEIMTPEWKQQGCAPALGVALVGNAGNVAVCWEPSANATSYVVEMSRDEAFSTIESSETTSSTTWSKSLPEGRYFLRTRAVDADTLVSRTSSVRKLGVVSFDLPPGASANLGARTVVLPPGRGFQLRDTTGLETALDRGIFVTLRGPLVMDTERSHQLRFRLVGDPSSETMLDLQRRELRADIEIGPKRALWPVDPIDITVTVRDSSGLIDATQVAPKLHVLLGLTELPVTWSHRGPVWSTRLAPRNVGPTVIRVLAEDEFGNALGRHFLEVDEQPAKPGETRSGSRRVAHN
jgi:hypothetical protein